MLAQLVFMLSENVSILGSDDATTCIIVVVRHSGEYHSPLAKINRRSGSAPQLLIIRAVSCNYTCKPRINARYSLVICGTSVANNNSSCFRVTNAFPVGTWTSRHRINRGVILIKKSRRQPVWEGVRGVSGVADGDCHQWLLGFQQYKLNAGLTSSRKKPDRPDSIVPLTYVT